MFLDFARLDFCRLIARRRSSSGLDTRWQSPYRCGSTN
jgi:hypothetical protein